MQARLEYFDTIQYEVYDSAKNPLTVSVSIIQYYSVMCDK